MYTTLALALAALSSALPAPQSGSSVGATPPKHKEFALAMKVDGALVSLNAVSNGTIGNLVLEAERLSVYPGTPAYFNGTGEFKALNFDVNGDVYGVGLPTVGDNYGYAGSAFAIYGYQEFKWTVYDGEIDHDRDAALNQFFACKDKAADGVENYFLKWGTQGIDGKPPVGCQTTEVVQNCNVEGGLKCTTM